MNEEQPVTGQPDALADARRDQAQPPVTPPHEASRRLRELLAVPERERTDAIWDEIIGLEIQLAPGNRAISPQDVGRRQEPGQHTEPRQRRELARRQDPGRRPEQARRHESSPGAKSARRFFKRPKRSPGT